MKNLILFGLALCWSGSAAAQVNVDARVPVNVDYAVNIKQNDVIDAAVDVQDEDEPVQVRKFSKTFAVDRADKINLNNQFGYILLKTWDRKEVKIDITISANSTNDGEARKLIEQVNIAADKNGDVVSCRTSIGQGSRRGGRNKRREIKIVYVVYLPSDNPLTVSQQFGNVIMGDYDGPLSAKVQYGDFNAGNLSSANNYVAVEYGKTNIISVNRAVIKQQYGAGLTVGTVGTLDLDAQYVKVAISTIKGDAVIKQQYGESLKVGSVNNLDLNIQYATATIGTIKGNATIDQQYNGLKIGSAGKLNLRSEYAGVTIGALRGDGNFNMSYNNLAITEISQSCRNLTIDAEYVDITMAFNDSYNGDFTVQRSYGGFKYGSNVKARISGDSDDSSTKNYTGKIGNGGTGNIRVKTEYGSITFR